MFKNTALCALAIMGIGSTAGAATYTIEHYDLKLRYEGTSFQEVYIDGTDFNGSDSSYIPHDADSHGLKSTPFSTLRIGDLIDFRAVAFYMDQPVYSSYPVPYSNGGAAPLCSIGPVDCTDTAYTDIYNGTFRLAYSDEKQLFGTPEIGGRISYYYWTRLLQDGASGYFNDGRYYTYRDETAHFTVISTLAPVPLPASAALLPIGLGALAFMRKRRRRNS